jgi:diguanylate cyclase (GGDEF)-like protein
MWPTVAAANEEEAVTFSLRRDIATKLLLLILPGMLIGSVAMFLAFERIDARGRMAALQLRLDTFSLTLSAALVKPLWEFDDVTVERLFDATGEVAELAEARLYNGDNALVAEARGHHAVPADAVLLRRVVPLSHQSVGNPIDLGRLEVAFDDQQVRTQMRDQRTAGLLVLLGALLLLGGATLLAVRRVVARPLRRLRDSLYRNASTQGREPLVWRGHDEVGEVVDAYNQLLAEIDQHSRDIHHLAYHDSLTGLPNRQLLEDRLGHAIAVAERHGRQIAVLFADIDNFKVVNDTLGHKQGDRLLKTVAERIGAAVRGMDTVARWGGDEFVLVLETIGGPGEAANVAEKLIEAIGAPVALNTTLIRIGVSIGISLYPQDGRDVTALIKNADMALFEAKGRGRNTYHFFDQAMNSRALRRLDIAVALRHAIAQDQLELHYQPKVRTQDGAIVGAEALVRWRRPGEGLIPPGEFIPQAEESDLIVALGEWVVRRACAQIRSWRDRGFGDIAVAVNLSPRHFQRERDIERVIALVEAAGVAPSLIEIEVTESTVMRDPELAIALLWRLRERGFGIAIDDFGSGYSNLGYLRRLPIRTLKIDRTFVGDIEQGRDGAEIVRAIIAMANALGLGLVAEGVETEAQFHFLREAKCAVVQGFYFSRPLPVEAFEQMLRAPAAPVALPGRVFAAV